MANQTSALIETLGLEHADVLGWSMGSMIAQALAVTHPGEVNRLILCATYPGNGTAIRPTQEAIDALTSTDPQEVTADLFPADQAAAASGFDAALAAYPTPPPVPAAVITGQGDAIKSWWSGTDPAGRHANAIAVPTLVADGTSDRLDPVANSHTVAKLIRGAVVDLFPDAGHAFLFQDQGPLIARIESFLR